MLGLAPFAYEAPDRLSDALALCAEPGAMPIAGGTDAIPSLKHRLFAPKLVVSLRRVQGLNAITEEADGTLSIGAGVRLSVLAADARVRAHWPALAAACLTVATPTIQRMATIGGNVMLDTRCMYYNQPEGWRHALGFCLKREGTLCHVAPKGPGCLAAQSADTVPVLWLYGARVVLASVSGERMVPLLALFTDDGASGTIVTRGEVLTRILVPRGRSVGHRKLRTRAAIDYALLLTAVSVDDVGARAVLSAVGPRPIQVRAPTITELPDAAFAAVQPLGTHLVAPTWRKRMVRVEVRRALEDLAR